MKPLVERLKTAYEGKVEFRVYVDTGDPVGDGLAQQFNIQYVPSFVFVNADGSVSGQMIVGGSDETTLRQRIDALK
jgi:thioredoxin-like negative regulator of GroEL